MGRLFWKFFLFIWLVQLVGIAGVGTFFWIERQQMEAQWLAEGPPHRSRPDRPPPDDERGPPDFNGAHPPREFPPGPHRAPDDDRPPQRLLPGGHRHTPLPLVPLISALLVSLCSAWGLAWYFSKPIRHLRRAFDAAADGDLSVRVGDSMGSRRDELADLGRDFDRMSGRLDQLVDGQKRLLHDVSHEMRSPLARLQAAIGLVRQQPGRLEDSLQRIEREGERMNLLVGELLTLSRLEAGVGGRNEAVDLADLLEDLAEDARYEGASRHIGVELTRGPLREVQANPELLHRAIENVVRNALRFSPEHGLVRIEAGVRGEHLFVRVIDQGPGVKESELTSLFKPFFRGGGASSGDGYGLGLAIAQRVIEGLNGKISARNGDAGGLIVEILLI
ncbi:MAG: HAMP domain-containing protein [Rhodocyclales bacterium GT-UBC]|nr:MAG: HAMP domain-containing protein [Rhodocyclales bacterium GT-UBC]